MGRRPKPTELHKLEGTFNATRHGKGRRSEPKAVGNLTVAPEGLTDGQREAWTYALTHAPKGILRMIDRNVLLAWVLAEDRLRMAMKKLAEIDSAHPLLVARGDALVASPYVAIAEKATISLVRLAGELGFSPAARPRMAVPIGPGDIAEPKGKRGRGRPTKEPVNVFKHLSVVYGGKTNTGS